MDLFDDLPTPKNNVSAENSNDPKATESLKTKRENDDASNDDKSNKKLCTDLVKLKAYSAERRGERDEMQDRYVIIEDFLSLVKEASSEIKRLSYYAVFDGHAGARASEHCANRLHKILAEKFPKSGFQQVEKDIKRCFIDTFKACDDEFLKIASKNKPAWKDGSTATVVLIINDVLYVANIGDSKAVIYRKNDNNEIIPIELTKDHNPTLYEERQRIQKCGAQVKDGRVLGVLEVSRSIGDGQYKTYGVICTPDVRKCQLNSNYSYVIIGCDGLWKSFKNEDAIDFVNSMNDKTLKNLSEEDIPENKSKKEYINEICCNKLANEAVKKLTADNVTVILIAIDS